MAKHGVKLITLRDCFEFLHWLHDDSRMQHRVATELVRRYGNSYNRILFTGKLPADVSEFLERASTFYKKLVATPIEKSYVNPRANDVTDALLECMPKFLAALYFLLYNVDRWFEAVGGGKWRYNYPGWETTWVRYLWDREWGGELQNYLRASGSYQFDVIPGGFGPGEVTYGYDYGSRYGYWYGESMVDDLQKILYKHNDKYNYFRDVFFTTVISKSGLQKSNTANVLALVKVFCEIVISVKSPDGVLKTAVQKKNTCIDWEELKQHCKTLEQQLGKLFNIEGFSFTGQARRVDELNTDTFAGETAEWFRNNLHEVQHNVKQIDTKFPVDNTRHLNYLQQFATKNIFPYGFIFGKDRYGTLGDAWKTLSDHWPGVIDMLGKNGGGLAELKRILDGGRCRPPAPPPKPRPRPAPAPRPPRPARPAPTQGASRTSAGMTTGARHLGGSLSRGSQGSGARGVGGHNRRSMIQVRGGGQNSGKARGPQEMEDTTQGLEVLQEPGAHREAVFQGIRDLLSPNPYNLKMIPSVIPNNLHLLPPVLLETLPSLFSQGARVQFQQTVLLQTPSVSGSNTGSDGVQGTGQHGGGGAGPPGGGHSVGQTQTPSNNVKKCDGVSMSMNGKSVCYRQPTIPKPTRPSTLYLPSDVEEKIKKADVAYRKKEEEDRRQAEEAWERRRQQMYDQYDSEMRQMQQAQLLSVEGFNVSDAMDGNALPDVSALVAQKQKEAEERSIRRNIQFLQTIQDDINNNPNSNDADSVFMSGTPISEPAALVGRPVKQTPNHGQAETDAHKQLQPNSSIVVGDKVLPTRKRAKPLLPVPPVGVPMGHAIEPPKLPRAPKTLSAPKDMLDVTGQPITHTALEDPLPPPPALKPPEPVEQYPPKPVKVDTEDMTKYLGVSEVILTKSTGSDIAVPPPHKVDTHPPPSLIDAWTIPNPKRNRPTPPTADVKIPSIEISPDSRIMTESMLDVMGSPTTATNTAHPLPPLSALNLPWQRDDTVSKLPLAVTLKDHDIADLTHVASEVIKIPIAQLTGDSNLAVSVKQELTGQPVADTMLLNPAHPPIELEIEKRHKTEIAFDAQIEAPPTATQGFTKPPSRTTVPPMEWIEPAISMMSLPGKAADAFTVSVDEHDNVINPGAAEFLKKFDLNTTPDVYQCQNPWEMLHWMVGLNQYGYVAIIKKHIEDLLRELNEDASQLSDALEVTGDPTQLTASHISNTLTQACLYSASVLHRIRYKDISTAVSTLDFSSEYSKLYYSIDPACLLCQLRAYAYAYACYHQLTFLKSQCSRKASDGGWQHCQYGVNVSSPKSPLQAFLTDAPDSKFDTHPFDPCNICLKSHVSTGLRLSKPHDDCPDWDILGDADLNAVKGVRGSATPNSIHRDNDHPNTLSTLLGCGIDDSKCSQLMKPITYRAYAVYSPSFAHHYLSWAVYLADRLWDSLLKLHYDLENLQCHDSKSKPLHQCTKALPLLYSHGITPPDGTVQSSLTCSAAVTKLGDVVAGKPIASLMTAMDTFLYGIRAPFLYTITALWLIATLYILHSLLYRMDVLRIRSHLLTTRASHLIDVKALLSTSRRMLSLYKDVDYFDDDFHS
ncbi:ribosome binding protein [Babesia ovata]|uniref:Ribosome binding protein n=1 Tax=Babesia ovata TaxID=189622 RepID=A0A2H6KG92_9APIC|nr:ribosome binding protein [Babesia ovata]GBE61979.1 ribosome binding protein [Babesia ovata]